MNKWVKQSIYWSLWMTLLMGIAVPYFSDEAITLKKVLSAFVFFSVTGFIIGYFFIRKQTNKTLNNEKMG